MKRFTPLQSGTFDNSNESDRFSTLGITRVELNVVLISTFTYKKIKMYE